MSVAVRTLSVERVTFPFMMTRQHCGILGLAFAVLFSAFSLIYDKDVNRQEMGKLQQLGETHLMERNQQTELLVQVSQLSGQGYIAQLARNRLNMQAPDAKKVVMLRV